MSKLNIQVMHGTQKYDLVLYAPNDSDLLVADLACEVEKISGVPVNHQKLIYRGRCLQEHATSLRSLGISNGCRIMLVGQKTDPQDEENSKVLLEVTTAVDKVEEQVKDVETRLDGLGKGYLDRQYHGETLSQVDKQLRHCCEYFMRHMEQLDALSLTDSLRVQRRSLLNRIQDLLTKCDNLKENVNALKEKSCR